jgi:large subunit ribosomal protein L29
MPFLRLKEIREMTPGKRLEKLEELRTELSKLRAMNNAGGAIENPSRIKEVRRAIARMMTLQNERVVGVKDKG